MIVVNRPWFVETRARWIAIVLVDCVVACSPQASAGGIRLLKKDEDAGGLLPQQKAVTNKVKTHIGRLVLPQSISGCETAGLKR